MDGERGRVDVIGTALRFAELLKEDPRAVDRAELQRGERLLSLYQDANYSDGFRNLRALKAELFKTVIEDLADRARVLSGSYYGVFFVKGQLKSGAFEYASSPEGSLVYKIALKDVAGFQKWRKGEGSSYTPEDLHAGIYLLTVELSRLL